MRLLALTCEVLARAVYLAAARSPHVVDVRLNRRGLHDDPPNRHPGTYWYVQDYLERTDDGSAFGGVGAVSDAEARATHEAYVAKYGEDNATYLMEMLGAWRSHYDRAAYVDIGVADRGGAGEAEARARDDAERRGWTFDKLAGELVLVRRLIDADWGADDFLVVEPGQRLAMSYDDAVIRAEPAG